MNFTYKVYGDRVIGLGYPKFAQAGIEWPPYSPDLNVISLPMGLPERQLLCGKT